MERIIEFLEEDLGIEAVGFVEKDGYVLRFTGFVVDEEDEDEEREVEVLVTLDNRVYVDGIEQDVYMPFNVWSEVKDL